MKHAIPLYLVVTLILAASALATATFIDPTYPDGTRLGTTNSVRIDTSIAETGLSTLAYTWNGQTYNAYDANLILSADFDNNAVFGEGSNKVVYSKALNGKNGTCGSATCLWNTGFINGGMTLNGVNPVPFAVAGPASLTYTAWINPNVNNNKGIVIIVCTSTASCTGNSEGLYIGAGGQMTFYNYLNPTLTGTTVLNNGKWYHVAVTATPTYEALYINGVKEANATDTHALWAAGAAMLLDGSSSGLGRFNGTIDNLNVYNRELTPFEINQSYMSYLYEASKSQWYYHTMQGVDATYTKNFSDATYTYQVTTTGTSGGNTDARTIIIDSTTPTITLNSPLNNTLVATSPVTFKFTPKQTSIDKCKLYGNFNGTWGPNVTISDASSGVQSSTTQTIREGTFVWNVWCNNTIGKSAFALNNFTITTDVNGPTIAYTDVTNPAGKQATNYIGINVLANDTHYANWTGYLYNSSGLKQQVYGYNYPLAQGLFGTGYAQCMFNTNGSITCFQGGQNYTATDAVMADSYNNHLGYMTNTSYGNITYLGESGNYTKSDAVQFSEGYNGRAVLTNQGNVFNFPGTGGSPTKNYTGGDAIQVMVGGYHEVILLNNGNTITKGTDSFSYGFLYNWSNNNAIKACAGWELTCVLTNAGNAHCAGYLAGGDYNNGDAVDVACGDYDVCVLKNNGNTYCWGYNYFGQDLPYTGGDAVGVSFTGENQCVLTHDGNILCWGDTSYPKLNAVYTNTPCRKQNGYTFLNLTNGVYNINATACDTLGNCKSTPTRQITIGPLDTCTPPASGVWNINCADMCSISTPTTPPNSIRLTGTGTFKITSSLFMPQNSYIYGENGCNIFLGSNGMMVETTTARQGSNQRQQQPQPIPWVDYNLTLPKCHHPLDINGNGTIPKGC